MTEEQEMDHRIDTIISNRERRFKYLIRNDRTEDAICIGDEFYEWINPDVQNEVLYYDERELAELYENMIRNNAKKRRKRGRGGK